MAQIEFTNVKCYCTVERGNENIKMGVSSAPPLQIISLVWESET